MRTRFLTPIAVVALGWIVSPVASAQTITVEMLDHFSQTSASAPTATALPFSFEVRINANGAISMTNWGPAYSIPGGSVPGGSASNTNTGTKNFSASPNSGANFFFQANYGTASAMTTDYPAAGAYGINFAGSGPPTPATFTSGLTFSSGTYSTSVPQVTGFNNGASWSPSTLNISTSGTTTLALSAFSEYLTSTNGAQIQWKLTNQSGTALAGAGANFGLGYTDGAITQLAIDGSLLTAGQTYTLSIQYGILAGAPGTTSLSGTTFTGVAEYWNHTDITITATAIPEPGAFAVIAGATALLGACLYRRQSHRHKTSP